MRHRCIYPINKIYLFYFLVLQIFIGFNLSVLYAEKNESSVLVEVSSFIPGIHIDLKYATTDNFTGEIIYDFQYCLLHIDAVRQLKEVQEDLEIIGLSLKIWDGYRPFKAQEKFWELVPDPRYVSNPKKGGRHTRGTAVDLTLVTLKDGEELCMPSKFDDFSEKAHGDYKRGTKEEIYNRGLLKQIMEKHGFVGLATEWWHFDLAGWRDYPPIIGTN